MNQGIKEQLSALLDGELLVEEEELLLRRLEQDPDFRTVLGRYSLIGDLMRDPPGNPGALHIGDHVLSALTEESPHSVTGLRVLSWNGVGKGLAGIGIAAAVAMMALTSLVGPGSDTRPANSLAQVDTSYTVPVEGIEGTVIAPARLTGYLVSHGEFSSAVSRRAMDSHIVKQMPETTVWKERANTGNE
jgi:negative regulator of sigma E activity